MQRPSVGSVIRYSYLWAEQAKRGLEEGVKDRPCAVVITIVDNEGRDILYVMPITHSEPAAADLAIEIPQSTKRRLRLDEERSWIVTREYNSFAWPGPDIRPDRIGEVIIGALPYGIVDRALASLRAHAVAGRVSRATRS